MRWWAGERLGDFAANGTKWPGGGRAGTPRRLMRRMRFRARDRRGQQSGAEKEVEIYHCDERRRAMRRGAMEGGADSDLADLARRQYRKRRRRASVFRRHGDQLKLREAFRKTSRRSLSLWTHLLSSRAPRLLPPPRRRSRLNNNLHRQDGKRVPSRRCARSWCRTKSKSSKRCCAATLALPPLC